MKARFSEKMIQGCLEVLEKGEVEDLFEILPRIGVLRDPRFDESLLALLRHEDTRRREFAAYAMGALGRHEFLDALKSCFRETEAMRDAEELQVAILEAIGAIGDDAAVEFFLPLLESSEQERRPKRGLRRRIVEAMGAIAQQGGERTLAGLIELTRHDDPELRAQALSEIAVAYWHRPNEIPEATLRRIYELRDHRNAEVAESALAALQSLADVGCRRAERLFKAPTHE